VWVEIMLTYITQKLGDFDAIPTHSTPKPAHLRAIDSARPMLVSRRQQVLQALQRASRPVSKRALAEQCDDVHERTISRLIAELIDEGVRIERTLINRQALFQLKDHFTVPGTWFTADTVRAFGLMLELVEQLGNHALQGECKPLADEIKKLTKAAVGSSSFRGKIVIKPLAQRPVNADVMAKITRAVTAKSKLNISYQSRGDNTVSLRTISPGQLELYRNNWYLLAWCHKQRDYRYFAVERIQQAQVNKEPANPESPPPCLRGYGIFDLAATQTATLKFTAHRAKWVAEEIWHSDQQDSLQDDGSLIRKFPYGVDVELIRDLMREGADVEVMGPKALRDKVLAGHRLAGVGDNLISI
jgi:proteasome accessory factor C